MFAGEVLAVREKCGCRGGDGGGARARFTAILGHNPACHLPVPSICGVQ